MRRLSLAALLALAATACGSPTDARPTVSRERLRTDPSLLLSPADKGTFVQNDPSIGCPANATRGYGFRTRFDWADVDGAAEYAVVFQHEGALYPAIVHRTASSEYEQTFCNAFVIDANLEHWTWRVLALGPAKGPASGDSASLPRDTLLASTTREYGFEPCRLADGQPCSAPPTDTVAAP
jgi:hypothetical protein